MEHACAGLPMSTPAQLLHVVQRKDLVLESDKPAEGQTEEEFVALKASVQ